jgi:hypothetical protein
LPAFVSRVTIFDNLRTGLRPQTSGFRRTRLTATRFAVRAAWGATSSPVRRDERQSLCAGVLPRPMRSINGAKVSKTVQKSTGFGARIPREISSDRAPEGPTFGILERASNARAETPDAFAVGWGEAPPARTWNSAQTPRAVRGSPGLVHDTDRTSPAASTPLSPADARGSDNGHLKARFSPFFKKTPPLFDRYPTVYARFSPFSRFLKFRARKIFFCEKSSVKTRSF